MAALPPTTWLLVATSQPGLLMPCTKKIYKGYIKTIVKRYEESTGIFACELANEPRCHGCPKSTMYNWASEVSESIKDLNSDHMVTQGDEGWLAPGDGCVDVSYASCGAEVVDFALNLKFKTTRL